MQNRIVHRNPSLHSLTTNAPRAHGETGAQPPSFLMKERVKKERREARQTGRKFPTSRWINRPKFFSALTALLFFLTNVLWAHVPESNFWSERKRSLNQKLEGNRELAYLPELKAPPKENSFRLKFGSGKMDPRLALIPEKYAAVKDVFISPQKGAPLILLVQDVHLNLEAQENIAGVLEGLSGNNPAAPLFVGVEGAFGPFDFESFRAFSAPEVGPRVREFLFQNRKIAAPSLVGLKMGRHSIRLAGIDDRENYEANVSAYKESAGLKKELANKLWKLFRKLDEEKSRNLSSLAREFDAARGAFLAGKIGVGEYLVCLKKFQGGEILGSDSLVLEQFLSAYQTEKSLDFNLVEKERREVLKQLVPKLTADELKRLAALSMALKTGEVSFADYYGEVKSLMERRQISLSKWPAFDEYIRYVLLAGGINSEKLFGALGEYEKELVKIVGKSAKEREILERSKFLHLLGKLSEFGLTPTEWAEYRQLRERHQNLLTELPIDSFENFYGKAEIRSGKMVENFLQCSAAKGGLPPVSVLLAGGFHSPALSALMRKKGFSYAVLQPKITRFEGESGTEYLSIFTREKTPVEKLFAGEKLFLAPAELELGSGSSESAAVGFLYKLMGVAGYQKYTRPIPPEAQVQMIEEPGPDLLRDLETGKSVRFDQNLTSRAAEASPFGEIYLFPAEERSLLPGAAFFEQLKGIYKKLLAYPPIQEVWFPVISVGLDWVFPGTVLMRLTFVLANAYLFAALFHDNTKDGRFSWTSLAIRTIGAGAVLAGSWGIMWGLGVFIPGQSLVSSLIHQGWRGLGGVLSFLALTVLGHALWNSSVRREWRLTIAEFDEEPVIGGEDEFWNSVSKDLEEARGGNGNTAIQKVVQWKKEKDKFVRAARVVKHEFLPYKDSAAGRSILSILTRPGLNREGMQDLLTVIRKIKNHLPNRAVLTGNKRLMVALDMLEATGENLLSQRTQSLNASPQRTKIAEGNGKPAGAVGAPRPKAKPFLKATPIVSGNGPISLPVKSRAPPVPWIQAAIFISVYSLLFFLVLPYLSSSLLNLIPDIAIEGGGFDLLRLQVATLRATAWLLMFAGDVVVILSAIVVGSRILLSTQQGQKVAKWFEGKKKKLEGSYFGKLFVELLHTMYGFGFEKSDRLYKIYRNSSLGKDEALDGKETAEERLFRHLGKRPSLQLALLPIFATVGLLKNRLKLMVYSNLFSFGFLSVTSGMAALILGPGASLSFLNWLLTFNLLDPLRSGWTLPFVEGRGIGGAAMGMFGVFGIFNSFGLSFLLRIGSQTTEGTRAKVKGDFEKGFWRGWLKSIPVWVWLFLINFLQTVVSPARLKTAMLQSAKSAYLPGGLHWVNLEISVLTSFSFGWLHDLVLKIEGDKGVLGSGQAFVHQLFSPFGLNAEGFTVPFTGGKTQKDLMSFDLEAVLKQEKEAAKKLMEVGLQPGDIGLPPEKLKLPPPAPGEDRSVGIDERSRDVEREFRGDYVWIPERALLSKARLDLWRSETRIKAKEFAQNNGLPVLLPDVAVDESGIPILTEVIGGRVSLVYTDGTHQFTDEAQFDPAARAFSPVPGKNFKFVELDLDPQKPLQGSRGIPLRTLKGDQILPAGFIALPRGASAGDTAGWRDPVGGVSLVPAENEYAVPIDLTSGFEIVFGEGGSFAQRALEKSERDLEALRNRRAVTRELLENPQGIAAVIVDPRTYEVKERIRDLDDLKNGKAAHSNLEFWVIGENGERVPFDPTKPGSRPDLATATDGKGDEAWVLFPVKKPDERLAARTDAKILFEEMIGTLSIGSHPLAGFETPPVYMIAERGGEKVVFYDVETAVTFMKTQRLGINIALIAGGASGFQDVSVNGWRLITNDSAKFKGKMMEGYIQSGARGGFGLRVTYDPETKELQGLTEIKTNPKEQRDLNRELTARQSRGQPSIVIVNGDQFQVYSLSPAEYGQFMLGRDAIQTTDGGWLVRMAFKNGEFYQKVTALEYLGLCKNLGVARGSDYLIKFTLAYKTKDGRILETYDDPKDVEKLLKRSDLVYVLGDGQRVRADKLPANFESSGLKVIGFYDPKDESTIRLGTEWQRLNYLFNEAVRREQISREKGPRTKPAVPEVVVNGKSVPYHPVLEWELTNFLENLRGAAERETNSALKQMKYEIYRKAAEERTYYRWNGQYKRFEPVVIKGTLLQRILQGQKERMDLVRARTGEILKASGKGGELVVPHGKELMRLQIIRARLEGLAKEWRNIDAKIQTARQARGRADRAPLPDLVRDQGAIQLAAQRLLEEANRIETLIQNRERARIERLSKPARRGERIDPSTTSGVSISIFGQGISIEEAIKAQGEYLRELRERQKDSRLGEAEKQDLEREFALALRRNSFIDREGNDHIVVSPLQRAEGRAASEERYAQLDRQFLEIQDKLLKGEKVLIFWKFENDGEKPVMTTTFDDPGAYFPQMRAKIAALPDGEAKRNAEQTLEEILKNRGVSRLKADRTGFQIALIDGEMAKGAALETVIDPKKEGAARVSFRLVSLDEAQKLKREKVAAWKKELQTAPRGAPQEGIIQRIRDAENGVMVYTDGGQGGMVHKWQFYYSEPETARFAQTMRERAEVALRESQSERDGAIVLEYDPVTKNTRTIFDEKEVKERIERLSAYQVALLRKYQNLKQGNIFLVSLLNRPEVERAMIASLLRKAEQGVFEEGGKVYIVKFGVQQARDNYARILEKYSRSSSLGSRGARQYTLLDSYRAPVGNVRTNGKMFLTTTAKVLDTSEKGLTLVRLETFSGPNPPTAENKGELVSVTWDFIDSNQEVVARGIGHLGSPEPLFVTINDFNGPLAGVDRPAHSQTYRFQKGLSLGDYPEHPELRLDSSSIIKRLEDGSLVIEQWTAHGKVSRDVLGPSGRIVKTMEGIYRKGAPEGTDPFLALRVISHFYDDPDYALVGVPFRSLFVDPDTGKTLGWSRVLTSFDEFRRTKELKYERWDETSKEMVWEVKNVNGQLVKKYALAKSGEDYVPYNLTVFYYDYSTTDSYGQLGLADEAYTFVTDERGWINGTVDPSQFTGDLRTLPFFEFTKIVKVEGQGPDTRIVYRVSVRDESGNVVLQFQEVKNPDGNLLEKYVIHEVATDEVMPSEVTFNDFDFSSVGFGKFKIAQRSRTFTMSFGQAKAGKLFDLADLPLQAGAKVVCFDAEGKGYKFLRLNEKLQFVDGDGQIYPRSYLASLPKEPDVSRLVIQDEKGAILYELTLKEESQIEGVHPDGRLTYLRNLFTVQGENDGRYRRVLQATFRDTVFRGQRIRSENLGTKEESFVSFDKRKWLLRGETVDRSDHPTWENKSPEAVTLEGITRQRAGIMADPFLPDLPPQLIVSQIVDFKDGRGASLYSGRRLVNSGGQPIVEIREKRSATRMPQQAVSIHLSDQDPLKFKTETLEPGVNHLATSFAAGQAAEDISDSDFVYFCIEDKDINYRGPLAVKATFKDKAGGVVTVSSKQDEEGAALHFWLPVQGKSLKFKNSAGEDVAAVEIIAESVYANKQFVFAVPVASLIRHIDVHNMSAEVDLAVEVSDGAGVVAAVSEIYRVGRGKGQVGGADLTARDDSFLLTAENGGVAFYDATKSSDEGRAVEIRGPDNRLLGVFREYWIKHDKSGVLIKDLRLVLYDETGRYPLASVPVRLSDENEIIVDLDDPDEILPYAVYERGDFVEVVTRHPIHRENLVRSVYRKDALDPSRAEETLEGDFSSMPQINGSAAQEKAFHQLYNAPTNLLARNGQNERDEIFSSNAALGVVTPELQAELKKSYGRLAAEGSSPAVLGEALEKLAKLKTPQKVVEAKLVENVVPPLPWRRLQSGAGLFWLLLGGVVSLVLAGYPIILHLYSHRWSKKVEKYRRTVKEVQKKLRTAGFKYYTPEEESRAMRRHAENVLKAKVHPESKDVFDGRDLYVTSNEDIEGPFLLPMIVLYVQAFAGINREYNRMVADIHGRKISTIEKSLLIRKAEALKASRMRRLDYFTRGVYKFLAVELARGNAQKGVSRYPQRGAFRPQIVSELNRLLAYYREKMAVGMINDELRNNGEPPLISGSSELRDISFKEAFEGMLRELVKSKVNKNGQTVAEFDRRHEGPNFANDKFRFNEKALESFLEAGHVDSVPPIYQFLGRYLFKLAPVFWGIFLLRGGELIVSGIPGAGFIVGLIALGIGCSFIINSLVEARAIFNARVSRPVYGRMRIILPGLVAAGIIYLLANASLSIGAMMVLYLLLGVMALEMTGLLLPRFMILGGNRSVLGVGTYYHFRPPAYAAGFRDNAIVTAVQIVFTMAAVLTGVFIVPTWFFHMFTVGSTVKALSAGASFIILLCTMHLGIYWIVKGFASLFFPIKSFDVEMENPKRLEKGPGRKEEKKKSAHIYIGGQKISSPIFKFKAGQPADLEKELKGSVDKFVATLKNRFQNSDPREAILDVFRTISMDVRLAKPLRNNIAKWVSEGNEKKLIDLFEAWLLELRRQEWLAQTTLWDFSQMYDSSLPGELRVGQSLDPEAKAKIERAWEIQAALVQTGGFNLTGSSLDVAFSFVRLAVSAREEGLSDRVVFLLLSNIYDNHHKRPLADEEDFSVTTENGQRIKLAKLLKYLSRKPGQAEGGAEAYVGHVVTVQSNKAAVFNFVYLLPEVFRRIGQFVVVDQNSTLFDTRAHWRDQRRMWSNPHLRGLIANRIVASRDQAVTESEFAGEGGSVMTWRGGMSITGTGWGNTVANPFWELMERFSNPAEDVVTFNPAFLAAVTEEKEDTLMNRLFGLQGSALSSSLISEDAATNEGGMRDGINLSGQAPQLGLSEARWYRARASRGDIEEQAKCKPRWVAGYFQMINDNSLQQAFDYGPHPYAVREMRAMEGDIWTLLPVIFLLSFATPWLTIAGASPYVGKVIFLFITGLVFNQLATLFAIFNNTHRMGWLAGWGRWLAGRNQDFDIWAFRTVREFLAVITGWNGPSSKFDLSGGGSNPSPWKVIKGEWKAIFGEWRGIWEARRTLAWEIGSIFRLGNGVFWKFLRTFKYPHSFAFTWFVGMVLFGLNFVSIFWLDALSVFMMLPLLRFSAGAAFGVFVQARTRGHVIGRHGWGDTAIKGAGMILSAAVMVGISGLLVSGAKRSLWLLGAYAFLIVAASAILVKVAIFTMNKLGASRHVKTERAISVFGRTFWDFMMWFGWFIFVPLAPRFKFEWFPGWTVIFTPLGFSLTIGIILGAAALVIFAGKFKGISESRKISDRYYHLRGKLLQLERRVRARPGDTNNSAMTTMTRGLLLEVYEDKNAGSWRSAKEAMDKIDGVIPAEAGIQTEVVAGAMGAWKKLGIENLKVIGWIEGFLTGMIGAGILTTIIPIGPPGSLISLIQGFLPLKFSLLLSLSPAWQIISASLMTASVLIGLLFLGHLLTGVIVPGQAEPVFGWKATLRATGVAAVGLISIIFIVIGLLGINLYWDVALITFGIIAGGFLHSRMNMSNPNVSRVREIIRLKRAGANRESIQDEILPVVKLGLDKFGNRGDIRSKAWVQMASPARLADLLFQNEAGFADAMNILNRALSNGDIKLYGSARSWVGAPKESKSMASSERMVVIPQGNKLEAVKEEIQSTLQKAGELAGDNSQIQISVLLNSGQEKMKVQLADAFGSLEFIAESELEASEDVVNFVKEKFLLTKGGGKSRLKVLLPAGGHVPLSFAEALKLLSQTDFQSLIRVVIFESLVSEGWVAEGGISLLEGMLEFRRLVGVQT